MQTQRAGMQAMEMALQCWGLAKFWGSKESGEGTTEGRGGQWMLDHENKESIYMRVGYQSPGEER